MLGNKRLDWLNKEIEEDEDSELLFVLEFFEQNERKRLVKWRNIRLNWNDHLKRERHTGGFNDKYHMCEESFNKLVDRLRRTITVDYQKSMNSTRGNGPIFPELIAACGLRFLGGELWKSLEDIFGIDISSVKKVVRMFFDAVDMHPSLDISLPDPNDITAMESLSDGFKSLSTSIGLFTGTVGAIDGWLCFTTSPIDRWITNKRSYYSGHYCRFGLNVQAVCDSRRRFLYFCVAAPGGTNDARAVRRCLAFQEWLHHLRDQGYFIVGDNPYVLSDELLIPFTGRAMTETQRTYNFFLSQMRIHIELSFGRLVTKWRIFRRSLEFGMSFNAQICMVAAKLHNFVINEEGDSDEPETYPGAPHELGYIPTNPFRADESHALDPEQNDEVPEPSGTSARWQNFLQFIQINSLTRPVHNIERNG